MAELHNLTRHSKTEFVLKMGNIPELRSQGTVLTPYKTRFKVRMTEKNKPTFNDFYLDKSEVEKIKNMIFNYQL